MIAIIPAVLFAGLAVYYLAGLPKHRRIRREEREARERRDRQAVPEPAEDAAFFFSLREAESTGRKR